MATKEGAEVIDYQVFRNLSILFFSGIEMSCLKQNPCTAQLFGQKHTLLWRCLTGQMAFFMFNTCLMLIPLTFQMIIFQTASFWTSILAYFIFKEPLLPFEMIAMVICFSGMITITLSGSSAAAEDDAEGQVADADDSGYTSKSLIIGYSLIFVTSWVYASNCILNRALKGMHHSVIMFWHGICGLSIALTFVTIEAIINGRMRIFHYDSTVYWLMLGGTTFDSMAVNAVTIAF